MRTYKQNQTVHPLYFTLVQAADHVSPATGVTPTVKLGSAERSTTYESLGVVRSPRTLVHEME